MRAGLFCENPGRALSCLGEGFKRCGVSVAVRTPDALTPQCFEPDLDFIIVPGMRYAYGNAVRIYGERGVPAVVLDLGYFRRADPETLESEDHYWQLGLNGLNWLPSRQTPPDRFDRLLITVTGPQRRTGLKRGDPVILFGQLPGDAAHGLDEAGVTAWANETVATLRALTDAPVLWRPHPYAVMPNSSNRADPAPRHEGSLARALREASAVVTINSTAGLKALVRGVPVFCRPDAFYAYLANTDLAAIASPYMPDAQTLRLFLDRLAYAQWTMPEMRDGTASRHILREINVWKSQNSHFRR